MARTAKPKPHVTLDMKGAACPGPMLGARRVLDDLLAGEVLLLISDCPGTKDDLLSWPRYADVEILKTERLARGGTAYYIRKGKAQRVSANAVKSVDHRGGLDAFLLKASDEDLAPKMRELKRQIIKKKEAKAS